MADGHGPVSGLLEAVYTGDVSASKEGFLRYQLLKLGGGSDSEGPNEVDSNERGLGRRPTAAALEASRRHEVKPKEPSEDIAWLVAGWRSKVVCRSLCVVDVS